MGQSHQVPGTTTGTVGINFGFAQQASHLRRLPRLPVALGIERPIILSGAIKAVLAGTVLMTIGSVIAGIPDPFLPIRLLRLFVVIVLTSFALVSMMFLIMVRMTDPLMPRAIFGVLNTLLFSPSGAVYPPQAF